MALLPNCKGMCQLHIFIDSKFKFTWEINPSLRVHLLEDNITVFLYCIYSILLFLMQIKYYNPVLADCQYTAWYFKTYAFGSIVVIQKVYVFYSQTFSEDF